MPGKTGQVHAGSQRGQVLGPVLGSPLGLQPPVNFSHSSRGQQAVAATRMPFAWESREEGIPFQTCADSHPLGMPYTSQGAVPLPPPSHRTYGAVGLTPHASSVGDRQGRLPSIQKRLRLAVGKSLWMEVSCTQGPVTPTHSEG